MKRAATTAAVLSLLLAGALARADWRSVSGLDGGVRDVWIKDAGYFSVVTNAAAYRLGDNGTSVGIINGLGTATAQCSAIVGDCLRAVTASSSLDECRGVTPLAGINTLDGCRVTENLTGYSAGLSSVDGTNRIFYSGAGAFGDAWSIIPLAAPSPSSGPGISARTIGGVDQALFPLSPLLGWKFVVNGATAPAPTFNPQLSLTFGTELFQGRDGGVRAVVGGADGGVLFTYQAAGVVSDSFDLGPIASTYEIQAVSLSELEGDQYGAGFGMAVVKGAAASQVYSAVPDPAAPGKTWVPNTALGSLPAPQAGRSYDRLRCLGARYCVLGVSGTTADPRVAVYRNQASPTVQQPNFIVDEGATATLGLDAGDPDGDAVYVTWTPEADAGTYLSLVPATVDGRSQVVTVAGANPNLCGLDFRDVHVDVRVSDGLASHVTLDGGALRVRHTRPVAPPGGPFIVPAGSPLQTFDLPYSALCAPVSTAALTDQSIQAPPLQASAAVVPASQVVRLTYQPPRVYCSATPATNQHDLRILEGPVGSDAGLVVFTVTPWGEPEAPFDAGRVVFQDAGSIVTYAPEATHLCSAAAGYPGTDTTWAWSSTGFATLPPVVLMNNGTPLPQGGGVTPDVTVLAPECEQGTVDFVASNTVRGGGAPGPNGSLRVNVETVLRPLTAGLVQVTAGESGGFATGSVDLDPSLNCLQLRGATADVALVLQSDGGIVSSANGITAPGPFSLPPGLCTGGQFHVRAFVRDSTAPSPPVGPVNSAVFTLSALDAGIDQVILSDFFISCGDAGRATATATFGAGQCPSSTVTWAGSGAVAVDPASGTTGVPLFTTSTDFGGLIGLPVDVTATATAGTGSASTSATARVTTSPFVTVVHRTDTPVASEARILGVEVTLTNPTACDVSSVEWHETLTGMSWVVGSPVVVGDAGVDAGIDGGELVVPGLSLPAGQSVTLRYSARPALFGEPTPGGFATLRNVRISDDSGIPSGQGFCGCQSAAGAWPALLALVAAAMLRRRRRAAVAVKARAFRAFRARS